MAEGEGQWAQGTQGRQWRVDSRDGRYVATVKMSDGSTKQSPQPYTDKESALRWARRNAGADANEKRKKEPSYIWHYGAE